LKHKTENNLNGCLKCFESHVVLEWNSK